MKLCLIATLIISGNFLLGQEIAPSSIASAGGYFENNNAGLSFSVGEIAIASHHNAVSLNEGILSVIFTDVAIPLGNEDEQTLTIYPVPANDWIGIRNSHSETIGHYLIHDLNGRTVTNGPVKGNRIDISGIPVGVFHLSLFSDRSSGHKMPIAKTLFKKINE